MKLYKVLFVIFIYVSVIFVISEFTGYLILNFDPNFSFGWEHYIEYQITGIIFDFLVRGLIIGLVIGIPLATILSILYWKKFNFD